MQEQVPSFSIPGEDPEIDASLARFRAAVSDVFTVEPLAGSGAVDVEAWHLGTIMLGSFRGPALAFERSAALVASSGLDHFLIQLYREGGFTGTADGLPISVSPGEIVIFDLTRTLSTRATAFLNLSLLIPRDLVERSVDDVASLHGLVLEAGNPLAGIFGDYLVSLTERSPHLSPSDAIVAALATASLAGSVLAREVQRNPRAGAVSGMRSTAFRSVVGYIDANLSDPELDAAKIMRALAMTRPTLYRLFVASGGIASFIRRRRLIGAALELANPQKRRMIADTAFRWGFRSESSFSRAFRQEFGVPPRLARDRNTAFLGPEDNNRGSGVVDEQRFARWMRMLQA
ncbi:MAG: helix-turn-helix domain-containing protein [Pseudomonadota bacterium]